MKKNAWKVTVCMLTLLMVYAVALVGCTPPPESETQGEYPQPSEPETQGEYPQPSKPETQEVYPQPSESETQEEYPQPSEGLVFDLNGDGTCSVSGIGECTDADVVFPAVSPDGDSVTSIGWYAFQMCTGLTSITIPDSVTSIGVNAFYGCTGLTSITIPDSVTSILPASFAGCTDLTSITVDKSNPAYHSTNNCLIETDSKTLIAACRNSTIPADGSVTSIGWFAFSGCTGLTSITIPDSVTSIGDEAFSGCTGLTSITIPDSVTSIGYGAFSGCTGLTSITIPDSVTSIGVKSFAECTGLTSITFAGTKAQWQAIDGVEDSGIIATIHCTDGDITP